MLCWFLSLRLKPILNILLPLELKRVSIDHSRGVFGPRGPRWGLVGARQILGLELVNVNLRLDFLIYRVKHRGLWKLARGDIRLDQQAPLEISRILSLNCFIIIGWWQYVMLALVELVRTQIAFKSIKSYVSPCWRMRCIWCSFTHSLRPCFDVQRARADICGVHSFTINRIGTNESWLRPFAV